MSTPEPAAPPPAASDAVTEQFSIPDAATVNAQPDSGWDQQLQEACDALERAARAAEQVTARAYTEGHRAIESVYGRARGDADRAYRGP